MLKELFKEMFKNLANKIPSNVKFPRFCPQCGSKISKKGVDFCSYCGADIRNRN